MAENETALSSHKWLRFDIVQTRRWLGKGVISLPGSSNLLIHCKMMLAVETLWQFVQIKQISYKMIITKL